MLNSVKSLLFCLFLFQCGLSFASDSDWGEWKEAKSLYDAEKFKDAAESLENHPSSIRSNDHYNLGTIYYRLNRLGLALGHLEKAQKLNPSDPDIQCNLTRVKIALSRSLHAEEVDPSSTVLEKWGDALSPTLTPIILGFLSLTTSLCWSWAYRMKRHIRKSLQSPIGIAGTLVFIFTLGLLGIQNESKRVPVGVIIEKQIVRSGPGEHYMKLAEVPEGLKVRVLGATPTSYLNPKNHLTSSNELWQQIRYSPQGIGWVKVSTLWVL